MSKISYSDIARSAQGKVIAGATVRVYLPGTETDATIYADADGTALSNPLTAGSDGVFQFWVDPGLYKIKVSHAGFTDFILDNISIGVSVAYLEFKGSVSNSTTYIGPSGTPSGASGNSAGVVPRSGVMLGLRVFTGGTGPGAGESWTLTLRTGATLAALADTAVTVTLTDSEVAEHDTVNAVQVSAGDFWEIKMVGSAGAASRVISHGLIELIPT